MRNRNILSCIKDMERPVFTTSELSASSGKSLSAVTQALNYLRAQGLIFKVRNGIWAEARNKHVSAYSVIPFLLPRQRAYVSFISALHLHGIIEQIPQVITLASTSHTKLIRTKLGDYSIHQISPLFFAGFDWYKDGESFLIAEPEKALVDCLYLSAHKGRKFYKFPELHFPKTFSAKKARYWVKRINASRARENVFKKLDRLIR
jgi:predicted transcriptional regulator of viral defense system